MNIKIFKKIVKNFMFLLLVILMITITGCRQPLAPDSSVERSDVFTR